MSQISAKSNILQAFQIHTLCISFPQQAIMPQFLAQCCSVLGLVGHHPAPHPEGKPAYAILFWDPGPSSYKWHDKLHLFICFTKQTLQHWCEISCLSFLTLSGRRGKRSSFIILFVDFGFLWEVPITHSFFMLFWKAVSRLLSYKANSVPKGSPSAGQKGGTLCFSRQREHAQYTCNLLSFPGPRLQPASLLRSPTSTCHWWSVRSQCSCEPTSEWLASQPVINLGWTATCLPLQTSWAPLPHLSASFWKKESVSVLFGGKDKRPVSLYTTSYWTVHTKIHS